jgi:hypothetical protein
MIIRSVNGKPMALPPYGGFLAPPPATWRVGKKSISPKWQRKEQLAS